MTNWDGFLSGLAGAVQGRRRQLGISQLELAQRAGFQRTYVTDIERASRAVTLKTIWKLAIALEMKVSALMHHAEKLTASDACPPQSSLQNFKPKAPKGKLDK